MKKHFLHIFIFIAFCFLSEGLNAQAILSGYVKNMSGNGIANKAVIIKADLGFGNMYNSTVVTNNVGFYLDSLSVPGGQNIKFYFYVTDCNDVTYIDSMLLFSPHFVNFDICNNSVQNCVADFYAYSDTSNAKKVNFYNLSSTNTQIWKWKFGDSDSSIAQNPIHTYTTNGKYKVCITAKDTVLNCYNTRCDSVYVGIPQNCTNSFTYGENGLLINLQGKVYSALPTLYKWNFGDNSYGTGKLIPHTYQNPGQYTVTLQTTIIHPQTQSAICVYSSSKNITVIDSSKANIFGQVIAPSDTIDKGKVYLYKYKSVSNTYEMKDSTEIHRDTTSNIRFYYFKNVPYGKYITKAKLSENSYIHSKYAPTYCDNTIFWNAANAFQHNSMGQNHVITFIDVIPSFGSSSIGGHVYQGYSKNPGDPVPNVLLYLVDEYNDVKGYTYTNINGVYNFTGLNYGNYRVYADIMNKQIIPNMASINQNNPMVNNSNIYINSGNVTEIEESNLGVNSIYPNPTNNFINISFTSENIEKYSISLFNLLGDKINSSIFEKTSNSEIFKLDVLNIESGVYYIVIVGEDGRNTTRKISVIK